MHTALRVCVYMHLRMLTVKTSLCFCMDLKLVFTHVPTWNTYNLATDGYSINSFVRGLCRGGTGCTVQ